MKYESSIALLCSTSSFMKTNRESKSLQLRINYRHYNFLMIGKVPYFFCTFNFQTNLENCGKM